MRWETPAEGKCRFKTPSLAIHDEFTSFNAFFLTFARMHSVLFTGKCDGEFSYDIELEALDPLPVTVPLMQTELGRYVSMYVCLYT